MRRAERGKGHTPARKPTATLRDQPCGGPTERQQAHPAFGVSGFASTHSPNESLGSMRLSIGSLARRALGPRAFHAVARSYVRLFGDYSKIAPVLSSAIPLGAHVLDVGGGDGAPLNFILRDRPDLSVTMIDIAPGIGGALTDSVRSSVQVMPVTTLQEYCRSAKSAPNVVMILDVMHHVPPPMRAEFLRDLRQAVTAWNYPSILLKDVEPDGSLSARLNYLADRYISNDRNTSPIGVEALVSSFRGEFGADFSIRETRVYSVQPPHYAVILTYEGRQ